ncbi:MAG: protein-ADP-ribose hydrolase [Clostridia bacterium]|nr:protein-ADP-ribose hydrolase [Clostridia bacterium]
MIELEDYCDLINLNGEPHLHYYLTFEEKEEILNKLLDYLRDKFKFRFNVYAGYEEKRNYLRGFLNQLPPCKLDDEFFDLQNKLLSSETNEKKIIKLSDLRFYDNISMVQGDITTIAADAIVNAGNRKLLGCFVPLHSCIDNIIISAGGFQIRNDLAKIMMKQQYDEEEGNAKITSAYNLPSRFIIHTVGPCVFGEVSEEDATKLQNCYISSLELAKKMNLKSIAFCCISTGEFHFPNDFACKIAVHTVKNWLKETGYDIKVIFNVFKDIDRRLYEEELS